MCTPSIKLPCAKFNTNLTLQSYVLLPFNVTMTGIQRVKTHLEQTTFKCSRVQ